MNAVLQSVMSMPTARIMTDLMFVLVRRDTLEMENLAQVSSIHKTAFEAFYSTYKTAMLTGAPNG